jgi:urocanate hydratase
LSSDSFEETRDKEYLRDTKKDLENAFKVAEKELSQQDMKDLELINNIEEVDENEIAHKLLKEIEERELTSSEIRKLSEKVNHKKLLSSTEYRNI